MKLLIVVAMLLYLAGCETAAVRAMSPEEKSEWYDHKATVNRENWVSCLRSYEAAGATTVHINHQHDGRHPDKRKTKNRVRNDIRSDLFNNNCHAVVGHEGWIKY